MDEGERLAIEWACARLVNVYAGLVDAGIWDEVAALYTAGGLMTRPSAPDAPIVGRDAIAASFRDRPARYGRHLVTNIVVEVEGPDRARAESRILLFTGTGDERPPAMAGPPLVGEYRDVLVREAEGWRFAERRGSLSFRP